MNSIEFPEMNYKHFREKNAKFHIFLLLSIMGGISLITIYDRKFRHNRPEEGLPKMITYISPINMVAEDNHLYFAYKSPLGCSFSDKSLYVCRDVRRLYVCRVTELVCLQSYGACMFAELYGACMVAELYGACMVAEMYGAIAEHSQLSEQNYFGICSIQVV